MIGQLTSTRTPIICLPARSFYKHVEHVKPSYTAPFDVLTFEILSRETVFQEVGVFENLKRWLKAAPLLSSYLFWLIRYFTACSLFSTCALTESLAQAWDSHPFWF